MMPYRTSDPGIPDQDAKMAGAAGGSAETDASPALSRIADGRR